MATTKKDTKKNEKIANLNWMMLCKNALVDQQTNSLNLISVLEEVSFFKTQQSVDPQAVQTISNFSEMTFVNIEFTTVVQLERNDFKKLSPVSSEIKIKVIDPEGKEMAHNELPIEFEDGKKRLRAVISFNTLPVKNSGRYKLTVQVRNNKTDTYSDEIMVPFDVNIYE